MQIVSAILLCAALLLSGSASKDADPDLAARAGSYIVRVLQAAASYSSDQQTAFTAGQVILRSSPSSLTKAVTTLPAGTEVVILDSKTILNSCWYQVRSGSSLGWLQESSLRNVNLTGLEKNQATTKETASLYSSYSQSSRVLTQGLGL